MKIESEYVTLIKAELNDIVCIVNAWVCASASMQHNRGDKGKPQNWSNYMKWIFSNIPESKQDGSKYPQDILINLVFALNWTSRITKRSVLLTNPSKLRTDQNYKPKKKSWNKSSNMSKVVDMGEDSNSQVNGYNKNKGQQCCKLKTKKTIRWSNQASKK